MNESRCCSPLLPMSMPASTCFATMAFIAALPAACSSAGIDRLAARAPRIEPRQLQRARQAAGMRGENPLLASPHVPGRVLISSQHRARAALSQGGSAAAHLCPLNVLRRLISSITAELSRSPSPRVTQASSTAALSARAASSCPRLRGLLEDQAEILQRLVDEALRRVVAAHHLRALDVHHLRIGGRLPRHVEEASGSSPSACAKTRPSASTRRFSRACG